MKLKKLLELCSSHKLAAVLSGILFISLIAVLVCIQGLSGQKLTDSMMKADLAQAAASSSTEKNQSEDVTKETLPAITVPANADVDILTTGAAESTGSTLATETVPATDMTTTLVTVSALETKASITEVATTTIPVKPSATDATTSKSVKTTATTKAAAVATIAATQTAPAAPPATTAATQAATQAPTTVSCGSGSYDTALAKEVLELVNQKRSDNNLPALSWNDSLASTAQVRALEIVTKWAHTRPCGKDCFTAFPDQFSYKAENIGRGQSSAESVVDEWMSSSLHAANILNASLTQLGVACYIVDGTYYWVQDFGG